MYQRVIAFNDFENNAYLEVFLPVFSASDDPFNVEQTFMDTKTFQTVINGVQYVFPASLIKVKLHQIVVEEMTLSNFFNQHNFNLTLNETRNVFFQTKIKSSEVFERFYILEAFNLHYRSLFTANDFNPELISSINLKQKELQLEATEAYSFYQLNISGMFSNFNAYYHQMSTQTETAYRNELYKKALSYLSGGLPYEEACVWALLNKNYSKTKGLI